MANSASHASLPFPVKGARYTIGLVFLDADGDPVDVASADTERSIDGAAFADCTEEATGVSTGFGYITLTGDETNGSLIMVAAKGTNNKTTPVILYPRTLPVLQSGTAQAGAAGTITLASGAADIDDFYNGCIVKTTGGTGGAGGSGSLGNQARMITDYNGSTKVATISPNWETTPDNTTTYEVLFTDLCPNRLVDAVMISGSKSTADNTETFMAGTALGTLPKVQSNAHAADSINASALAPDAVNEINATVDQALADIGLDHVVANAATGADIADNSIVAQLVSKSATADWDTYDNETDSLEAAADATPDKTGYALAADGLDLIEMPEVTPGAEPTGLLDGIRAIFSRLFRRTELDITNGELRTYLSGGSGATDIMSLQEVTEDAELQVQDEASWPAP